MSSRGYRNIQLERQRREQLRLERVREKAFSLLDSCNKQIAGIKDLAIQQLAGPGLKDIRQNLRQVSEIITSNPDKALKDIKKAQKQLQALLSKAQQKASNFSKEQSEAKSMLEVAQQSLEAEKQVSNQASKPELEKVQQQVNQAEQLYASGRFKEALTSCRQAQAAVEKAGRKAFDETVRRETVNGLLSTLTGMGFVTENPVLEDDEQQNSKVRLAGTLPSGKKAVFLINLDGKMEFDFEGYQGRACAKDMEAIESQLAEQFSVKLGPAQVTWKNPDKIAKGALNRPSSNSINRW
jgi:hypothetical protein